MDTERWLHIKSIFQEAADRKEEERTAFLDHACGNDSGLRKEVEALLRASDRSEDFMESPAEAGEFSEILDDEPQFKRIGQYRIEKILSTGGMGTVYEALQENPSRTVAIKVLRKGIATKTMLRRFEYESEILARLSHPHIAQVFEAGTHREASWGDDDSLPYFVMEYVEGALPITEYAGRSKLSKRKTLALFLQVCDAVRHGHRKGIIHRDLKPSNILVDLRGEVKVIDFGVARVTDSDLKRSAAHTRAGQLIGTLQYMSPEQCSADLADIDVRSDVYALGIVLYELLCGKPPYNVHDIPVFEATRVVRETEPRRPSTVIRTLKGDVETIMLNALEKDRARRYQTVDDFMADIRRFLDGEVILARPAGFPTRAWKCVKRNPVASAVLGMAALAVVAFLGYILLISYPQLQLEREKAVQAQKEALAESENTKAINRFLEEVLATADPFRTGRGVSLRNMLDAAVRRIDREFPDRPEIEASLRYTLGTNYGNAGIADAAETQLQRSAEIYERIEGGEAISTLKARNLLGHALLRQGRVPEAKAILERTLETGSRCFGPSHEITIQSMRILADLYMEEGRPGEVEALLVKALGDTRAALGERHLQTMELKNTLGMVLIDLGRLKEAKNLLSEVVEHRGRVLGKRHILTLESMNSLATSCIELGMNAEAESLLEQVYSVYRSELGDEHLHTIMAMNNLANAIQNLGRYSEAESIYLEALELRPRIAGNVKPNMDTLKDNLANVYHEQGRFREAEAIFQEVIEARRLILGGTHPDTLDAMNNLANTLGRMGDYAEAEVLCREVLGVQLKKLGKKHTATLRTMNNLALKLQGPDRLVEAESMLKEVVELRTLLLTRKHPDTIASMSNLANVLLDQGRLAEAMVLYREALDLCRITQGDVHPDTFALVSNMAISLSKQGKADEAERLFLEALKISDSLWSEENLQTLRALGNLASELMKQERCADALPHLERGLDILQRKYPDENLFLAMFQSIYGGCLMRLERFEEAEEQLLKSHRGFKDLLGDEHARTQGGVTQLNRLYIEWGKPEKAAQRSNPSQ